MQRRQPLPRLWLMTDERQGEGLWDAVAKLPRGAGIVFRHYGLCSRQRAELLRKLKAEARRRRLVLVAAGAAKAGSNACGVHGPSRKGKTPGVLRTASAHNMREIRAAERAGADLLFLSPVFETRSHPGAGAMGPLRFMLLARQARVPVIALGGVNARRARRLNDAIHGWAGIDAWV